MCPRESASASVSTNRFGHRSARLPSPNINGPDALRMPLIPTGDEDPAAVRTHQWHLRG